MSHRIPLVLTSLVGVLAVGQAWADGPVRMPVPAVEILVDGAVRPAYAARSTVYVEALKGRPYEIRLTNPWPVRVAVALSVDGLNTIDARHSTAAGARKWVIEPYGTITISGWQTSLAHARRFEFTTEEQSYGAKLGQTADLGVIAAVFYRERVRPPVRATTPDQRGASGIPADEAPRRPGNAGAGQASSDAPAAGKAPASAPPTPVRPAEADEYAATGMGHQVDHAVMEISMDLEEGPAAAVSLRYEYRAQLVRLGVLPALSPADDTLARRERARGFQPGFCPDPKR